MSKLTLQQRLNRKKYKKPNKFVWFTLMNLIVRPFLAKKYNSVVHKEADIRDCKGPCFLIYNHQSRIDYVWITRCCYPRPLNFVVGYNEFFRSHLAFILRLLHAIPKKNFTLDLPSMRAMDSIIKQNGVVCFSPEGMSSISGHNQPVVEGTGRFIKKYGIPVYIIKNKGAFLTNTKVCLDERKGLVDSTISLLFTPDELKKMSADEIQSKMNEALWQDDYEWNKEERIKYDSKGRICHHLSDLLYRCPRCGSEFEMESDGDHIVCKHCGNGAKMNDYYDFEPYSSDCVIPSSPSRWVDEERKAVYQTIKNDPTYSFATKVKVGELSKEHYIKNQKTSEICGEGEITIDHTGLSFSGFKHGSPWNFHLSWYDLPTLGMPVDVTYFSFYVDSEYYDFIPSPNTTGKVLLLVEEMGRLHTGKWKNFPWMDWIYE